MRFQSLQKDKKKEKEKKDKKVGQSSGRGLCETSKSSDSVDLHLNTLQSGTVGMGL